MPVKNGYEAFSPETDRTAEETRLDEVLETLNLKERPCFDCSRDMRFVVNRPGRLLDVNQAGVLLFGFKDKEEMLRLDSSASLFCDPQDGIAIQRKIEEDGFVKAEEVELKRADGSKFIGCITANLHFNEDGSIVCEGLLQDVTERRQWREALIRSYEQNLKLSESERRIRELNEHILHMLMVVSHDIRGPLVSVAATLKLLQRGLYGTMSESVANTIGDLLSRVVQLTGIAEDFLGKAHSVEGSLQFEREMLDLRQDIIDPVLDELANDIERHDILIDNRLGAIPAGCILINVNKMWLKTVFRNLFRNAIKYGGKGCRIAFGFEDHGSYYRLNVYNSGDPIPEEHRDKLFTRFGRIRGGGRQMADGIGLGLYLIKEIVRKHGGDIWYEPKPDGSDFILTLAKETP